MTDDARHSPGAPDSVPDWDTLARFVAGEGSADEISHVSKWLDSNPAERALLDRLSEVTAAAPAPAVDVEAALAKVHARMGAASDRAIISFEHRPARRRWPVASLGLLAAAAAIVLLLVSQFRSRNNGPGAIPTAPQTYATSVGQSDSIMLRDGSRVVLGPDSRLTVPGDFGTRSRAVELRGDAYFDVRHDTTNRFEVRVGSALVQDVGTSFTVESDDANETVVTVVTGSVRLRPVQAPADAGVVLAAGERGSIDESGRTSTERPDSLDDDVAWTRGELVFRDAVFSRVAAEVHRWYGIRLHVDDPSLLTHHVTTTLRTDQSPDEVLHILELSMGLRIERQGDSAVVMTGRSSVSPPR